MSMAKANVLNYLAYSSDENSITKKYLKKLSEMVDKSHSGIYKLNINHTDEKFKEDFNELVDILDNVEAEFVPYAEITRIVYTSGDDENTDGLDVFQRRFEKCLSKRISNEVKDGEEVNKKFIVLVKSYEHLKLATTQIDSLFLKQEKQIEKQKVKITKLRKQISKETHKLNKIKSSVYGDFIAILGIFTAITFATFGGLQLLGHVFGSVKNATYVSIGSTIMLGSIYLIGTYLILIALLTGIAKLGDKEYIVSFPMRDALLGAFIAMFLFGFAYSNYRFLLNFIDNFWFKNYYFNFSLILFTFLLCVFLPGILDMFIYRRISDKTKGNSLKMDK